MRSLIAILLVLTAIRTSPEESARQFIPTGAVTAKVMQIALSPRAAELTAKLRAAIASNQEWWLEHVKRAAPGEPLPYDARMGLSRAEYTEYLQLAKAPKLRQVGEASLFFEWSPTGQVKVDSKGVLPDLDGLRIDLATDSVMTGYGLLAGRSEVSNTSPDSATGPWRGVQWKLESMSTDLTSGVVANLALGRLTTSGEGILYFNAKEIVDNSLKRRSLLILFYPLR